MNVDYYKHKKDGRIIKILYDNDRSLLYSAWIQIEHGDTYGRLPWRISDIERWAHKLTNKEAFLELL